MDVGEGHNGCGCVLARVSWCGCCGIPVLSHVSSATCVYIKYMPVSFVWASILSDVGPGLCQNA